MYSSRSYVFTFAKIKRIDNLRLSELYSGTTEDFPYVKIIQ